MNVTDYRHAAEEAQRVTGSQWRARVLEPSPPAVNDGEWFADDPVARAGDAPALLPDGLATGQDADWSTWLQDNPDHEAWVAQRWLGGPRTLGPTPPELTATRLALHRLATYVVAPVRHHSNGKFGLRWTLGGFGTPFFGDDRQVRVAGTNLIDQRGATVRSTAITSLQAAADFLETDIDTETAAEHDSPPVGDTDEQLVIDAAGADFLGNWFAMGFAALEQVRADPASIDPSRPQIWPGHFDPAIEIGDEDHRGSYGAAPGDHSITEPYLYVSLWWPDRIGLTNTTDPMWNASSFTGSILKLSDFGPGDPAKIAAEFFGSRRDGLGS